MCNDKTTIWNEEIAWDVCCNVNGRFIFIDEKRNWIFYKNGIIGDLDELWNYIKELKEDNDRLAHKV